MRRRGFLAGLGTALAWPVVGLAQQSTMPMIGFVNNGSSGVYASLVAVFQKGLEEAGYAESQSVTVEYRWADGDNGRLANLINDLLQKTPL